MSKVDVSELQGPLTELLQQFSGDNGRKRFREFKLWLKRVADNSLKELLALHKTSTIGMVDSFNPHEFFRTREGLWVSGQFIDRVFSQVSSAPMGINKKTPLQSHTLIEITTDAKIRQALPEDHVFEVAELCVIISSLIGAQLNGTEGRLLVNGFANLFYVKGKNSQVYVVFVIWDAVNLEWNVVAWSLVVLRWVAGGRIFSRNC